MFLTEKIEEEARIIGIAVAKSILGEEDAGEETEATARLIEYMGICFIKVKEIAKTVGKTEDEAQAMAEEEITNIGKIISMAMTAHLVNAIQKKTKGQ